MRVGKVSPSAIGKRRARRFVSTDHSDGGEHRQVTVLFIDVVGFTEFTARAGPEHAHALMQAILPILSKTVEGEGCRIKTFTGDGIVSFFGVPSALEDAPVRACRAAVAINQRLASTSEEMLGPLRRAAKTSDEHQLWPGGLWRDHKRRQHKHCGTRRRGQPWLSLTGRS